MYRPAEAPTKEQLSAGLQVIRAIADTIRELKEIPSGHLYARVMSYLSLDGYEKIITMLINGKMVEKDPSHRLRWIWPEPIKQPTPAPIHVSSMNFEDNEPNNGL